VVGWYLCRCMLLVPRQVGSDCVRVGRIVGTNGCEAGLMNLYRQHWRGSVGIRSSSSLSSG
jgi:hypothetical protein